MVGGFMDLEHLTFDYISDCFIMLSTPTWIHRWIHHASDSSCLRTATPSAERRGTPTTPWCWSLWPPTTLRWAGPRVKVSVLVIVLLMSHLHGKTFPCWGQSLYVDLSTSLSKAEYPQQKNPMMHSDVHALLQSYANSVETLFSMWYNKGTF